MGSRSLHSNTGDDYAVELDRVYYRVLRNISLRLRRGLTVVTGPNGSGKTSLLMLVAGVVKPWKGVVKVLGVEAWVARVRGLVSFSLNPPLLDPSSRVDEFLGLHWVLCGADRGAAERLARLFGVDKLYSKRVFQLSTGQRRRVDLVRALSCLRENGVLVLDEPSEGLDEEGKRVLVKILGKAVGEAAAALVSTNDSFFLRMLRETIGVEAFVELENGVARVKPVVEGIGEGRFTLYVRALMRHRIPLSELQNVEGVVSVDLRYDVDWILRRLGLEGLKPASVAVVPSTADISRLASQRGFQVLFVEGAMVEYTIVLSSLNPIVDVLKLIRDNGDIVDVRVERRQL